MQQRKKRDSETVTAQYMGDIALLVREMGQLGLVSASDPRIREMQKAIAQRVVGVQEATRSHQLTTSLLAELFAFALYPRFMHDCYWVPVDPSTPQMGEYTCPTPFRLQEFAMLEMRRLYTAYRLMARASRIWRVVVHSKALQLRLYRLWFETAPAPFWETIEPRRAGRRNNADRFKYVAQGFPSDLVREGVFSRTIPELNPLEPAQTGWYSIFLANVLTHYDLKQRFQTGVKLWQVESRYDTSYRHQGQVLSYQELMQRYYWEPNHARVVVPRDAFHEFEIKIKAKRHVIEVDRGTSGYATVFAQKYGSDTAIDLTLWLNTAGEPRDPSYMSRGPYHRLALRALAASSVIRIPTISYTSEAGGMPHKIHHHDLRLSGQYVLWDLPLEAPNKFRGFHYTAMKGPIFWPGYSKLELGGCVLASKKQASQIFSIILFSGGANTELFVEQVYTGSNDRDRLFLYLMPGADINEYYYAVFWSGIGRVQFTTRSPVLSSLVKLEDEPAHQVVSDYANLPSFLKKYKSASVVDLSREQAVEQYESQPRPQISPAQVARWNAEAQEIADKIEFFQRGTEIQEIMSQDFKTEDRDKYGHMGGRDVWMAPAGIAPMTELFYEGKGPYAVLLKIDAHKLVGLGHYDTEAIVSQGDAIDFKGEWEMAEESRWHQRGFSLEEAEIIRKDVWDRNKRNPLWLMQAVYEAHFVFYESTTFSDYLDTIVSFRYKDANKGQRILPLKHADLDRVLRVMKSEDEESEEYEESEEEAKGETLQDLTYSFEYFVSRVMFMQREIVEKWGGQLSPAAKDEYESLGVTLRKMKATGRTQFTKDEFLEWAAEEKVTREMAREKSSTGAMEIGSKAEKAAANNEKRGV